jgi:uncharacterized protein YgbK (DUF1537 family)
MSGKAFEAYTLLNELPPEWPEDLRGKIREQITKSGCKVVVLDDDPTGTQTVHGIPVLTEWSVDSLRKELLTNTPAFYILTNSRSLPLEAAKTLNTEIGRNLMEAATSSGCDFVVVSRSDSTLRGHFPGEMEALTEALGNPCHAWLLVPFFQEGGRYTIQDTHYVRDGDLLIPSGETAYAHDKVFGYRSSNLRDWVEEKSGGKFKSNQVASISINDLRLGGPQCIAQKLQKLEPFGICIVNAASYRDLEVLVAAILDQEACGRRFLYRTAASFVRVRAGIPERSLITVDELGLPDSGGGLIIAGSYVPKTTEQLEKLLANSDIKPVEVKVENLVTSENRMVEIENAAQQSNQALSRGQTTLVFTSRELLTAKSLNEKDDLWIANRISEGLVHILHAISERPRYLVAKGGITSSDLATKGLGVKRAMVLGQVLPGVPVWQLGAESRYPGLPFIVFPGNVGDSYALVEIVAGLRSKKIEVMGGTHG